jgi:hypothetical protein
VTALGFGLAVLATNLVYGARGTLFGFIFGDAAILVRVLDVLVLPIPFASFFDSAWHTARDRKI